MPRMTRGSSGFRRMAWLALVAVLLGAVVPTVSRAVASAAPGALPLLLEMCTPAGRKMVDMSLLAAEWGESAPPVPLAAMDEACSYCVLVPPLPLVLALLLALLLYPVLAPAIWLSSLVPQAPRNLRGLGARAPPIFL